MQVLAHPDPHVLEAELLDRIAAAQAHDPLAPVLVLVPTARLAEHARARIARRLGACLGVRVAPHRAVVLAVLQAACSPLQLAPQPVLTALLEHALASVPENVWTSFVRRRPGALRGLARSLRDLREARTPPAILHQAAREGGREADRALAEVYDGWVGALDGAARRAALSDEAGLVQAALPHVEPWGSQFHAVLHHGAYELTGMHLALVRAIDAARAVTFLLPCDADAPAYRHAAAFARRHLGPIEPIPDPVHVGSMVGARLRDLDREEARPEPVPEESISFHHAQGAGAELTFALRRAQAWVEDGTAPSEIAIVARSLDAYGAELAAALEGELPWDSSAGAPLRADPWVADVLLLLRVLADDLPRAATARLLRSPRLRWTVEAEKVEVWSRRALLLGGLEEWVEELPAWAARPRVRGDAAPEERERDRRRAEWLVGATTALGRELRELVERVRPELARSWRDHADLVEQLVRERLAPVPDERAGGLACLLGLLDAMRMLDELLPGAGGVPLHEALRWLEEAVGATEVPLREVDAGGARVLDARQARGLTFERVHVLGLHEGSFPRPPRSDPFLPDALRARVAARSGEPIGIAAEAHAEEQLLLALLLGSARERVGISWQRADDRGRTRAASTMLRELARLALGRPDMAALRRDRSSMLRAHPAAAIEDLERHTGLLTPDDALLAAGLRAGSPRPFRAVLERLAQRAAPQPAPRPPRRAAVDQRLLPFEATAAPAELELVRAAAGLASGLRLLAETESLEPTGGAYDARVEPSAELPVLSVSRLETLGQCPLRYFFVHVLRAEEMDPEPEATQIPPDALGRAVHEVLCRAYGERLDGPLRAGDLQARIPELWEAATADVGRPIRRRAPALWRIMSARWIHALARFVEEDVAELDRAGLSIVAVEQPTEGEVDLGGGVRLRLRARFDRVAHGGGRLRIGDYKTSRSVERHVEVEGMLRGSHLQVPLYAKLSGAHEVEVLGVHPALHEERGLERRALFTGFRKPGQEEGFLETLRVLVELLRRGRHPLRASHSCTWCAYRPACRRGQPPTELRQSAEEELADFRDLAEKTAVRKTTLEAVRGGPVPAEPA